MAASSIYGEVVVWEIEKKATVGYTEHQQNAKITSLVWKPDKTNEIAFCDALGQLSCIEVVSYSLLQKKLIHLIMPFI